MTTYHDPNSCNKCKGETEHVDPCYDQGHLFETKTKCKDCGFEDYWGTGFYESGSWMVSNCRKY